MYGITETTVHVTWRPIGGADLARPARRRARSAGRSPDLQVHLLDRRRAAGAAAASPGEIYVGGAGARARLPRPARARPPSASCPTRSARRRGRGARLYRTGDLARWPAGRRARVPRPRRPPGQDPRLPHRAGRDRGGARRRTRRCARRWSWRASATASGGSSPTSPRRAGASAAAGRAPARRPARATLPEHMVPAAFVRARGAAADAQRQGRPRALALARRSRTPRRGRGARGAASASRRAARSRSSWPASGPRCCGCREVGVHDNFFELGGDSILCIQIVARAGQAGCRITPRQLFEHPTIAGLAAGRAARAERPAAAEQAGAERRTRSPARCR